MASPKKYDKGIKSLLGQADRAFERAVKNSRRPGLIEALRSGVLSDYGVGGMPSMGVPPYTGPTVYRPDASQVLPPQYPTQGPPPPGMDLTPRSGYVPVARPDPAQIIAPTNPATAATAVAAPPAGPVDPNAPRPIGEFFGDVFGWRDIPETDPSKSGVPAPRTIYQLEHPSPVGDPGNIILGGQPSLSRTPYELTQEGRPYNARALQDAVDAAPGGKGKPDVDDVPPIERLTDSIVDWWNKKPPSDSDDEMRDTRFTPLDAMTGGMVTGDTRVLPPDTTDNPIVQPVTELPAPEIDASGLPGVSTETATGALSLDDYMKKMMEVYPDLDFSNPKQAEADANARRDMDRTYLLAQLSMAAGLTSGAGPSWGGIGAGFANYGGVMDKGFQKYQQALQDSADRYGKQQESMMAYDTARRQAALGMYTSAEDRAATAGTELWKAREGRAWDKYKLDQETKTTLQKQTAEQIDKHFDKDIDKIAPASTGEVFDEAEEKRKEDYRRASQKAREASHRHGYVIPTEQFIEDVAD